MNLTIRWKLILAIGLPLLVMYAAMLVWDYTQQRAAALAQMTELVTERATTAAAYIDSRLRAVMQMADTTAGALTARPALAESTLQRLLAGSLRPGDLAYAAFIALEPGEVFTEPPLLLLRRAPGAPRVIGAAEAGDYVSSSWFSRARDRREGAWSELHSEPFLGDALLYTYAAPFFYGDRFRGVVAVSVRADEIQGIMGAPAAMRPRGGLRSAGSRGENAPATNSATRARRGGVDDRFTDGAARAIDGAAPAPPMTWSLLQGVGPQGFVIIDQRWRIVSHPDRRMIGRPSLFLIGQQKERLDLVRAGTQVVSGEAGVIQVQRINELASDYYTPDDRHWIAYAPIPSTNWIFTTTIPNSLVVDPVRSSLVSHGAYLLGGLGGLILVVIGLSVRISRPIERLAQAVGELAQGNLQAHVEVSSRDELGQLAGGFNRMVAQLREYVAAVAEQRAMRERVDSELRIARQIQTDLLPRTFPPFPDRTEFELHAVNVPAGSVGGDFYDFFFVPSGLLTLVVGDVSGKGIPAALLMAVTRTIVRNLALAGAAPMEIVRQANDMLFADTSESMFATIFVCQYDPATGRMRYANAGHPRPYRVDPQGVVEACGDATAPLLGAEPSDVIGPFEQREEALEVGQTLLLYTDGVVDARSPDGIILGEQGLRKMLQECRGESPQALCQRLVAEVERFQQEQRFDDLTLLALRRMR